MIGAAAVAGNLIGITFYFTGGYPSASPNRSIIEKEVLNQISITNIRYKK